MEYICIIIFLITLLIILKIAFEINMKKIKYIGENNKKLDEIVGKYPENTQICKEILKMLKNENVKIQEENEANNCLYIAVSNKIIIANMRNSFTRIQTISHECLHSVQNRRILLFNFIYSNIYILFFVIISILIILKIIKYKMLALNIFIVLSYMYYFIRSYLENDAMIKARFIAEKYIDSKGISSKEEKLLILNEYDNLNNIGIKAVNYSLFSSTVIKVILLALLMIIF